MRQTRFRVKGQRLADSDLRGLQIPIAEVECGPGDMVTGNFLARGFETAERQGIAHGEQEGRKDDVGSGEAPGA